MIHQIQIRLYQIVDDQLDFDIMLNHIEETLIFSLIQISNDLDRFQNKDLHNKQDLLFGTPFQINIIDHCMDKQLENTTYHGHQLENIFIKVETKKSNHQRKSECNFNFTKILRLSTMLIVKFQAYFSFRSQQLLSKTSSVLSTHSSSNPCLQNSPSMGPNSFRYRSSRLSDIPQHLRRSFPPFSIDSYESSSITNCSLTPMTPTSQNSQHEQKQDTMLISPLPEIVQQHKKEHSDAIQRYDRLLEKMRATDEQLQTLSKSWTNNTQQGRSVSRRDMFY